MSMKEIARMTGLSIATVSHAINGTRGVSEKSLELVNNAAEEIGYKPSLAAKMLRTQKSGIVALIIPSSHPTNDTNLFYFGILNGARAALEQRGYDMIVTTYPESSSTVDLSSLRVIQTRMVEGILLVPYSNNPESLVSLESMETPVVLLDRTVQNSNLPTVKSDNLTSTVETVELLIKAGGRKIGFLGGKLTYSTVVERLEGYRKALEKNGVEFDEKLVITGLSDKEVQGYSAAEKLIKLGADGIFVENSMLMIGIVNYCNAHKVEIPNQLKVAGFDNAPWMDIASPRITAVQQNAEKIGEAGAELLINFIEEKPVENEHIVIDTRIVKRNSHGNN